MDGVKWDGALIGDQAFRQTCYGYFLELAKYVNHAEFMEPAGADTSLMAIGRKTKQITFEHNLIIVRKGDNTELSNVTINGAGKPSA
ncbi:MAG: hypothetical protein EXR07_21785 [Acetobacteraceae bacterium]|nr:hypothetical protein [Acetobacteraceae bacterium]